MKKIKLCLIFLMIFLTQCSPNDQNNTNKIEDKNNSNQSSASSQIDADSKKTISSNDKKKDKVQPENNISEKVKNYIINGQENKPEAQKVKWSKTFLNQLDIEGFYKQYIDTKKGNADDLESFSKYITLNAPIPDNWEELFRKDIYSIYGEKVVRVQHVNDDLYQAYIMKNDSEVPYVVVSARTGYFHG